MKKNNPAFKDEVDEILDKGVLNHWTRSQIKAALDQAYQEKFLERFEKEVEGLSYLVRGGDGVVYITKENVLEAIRRAAIKKEVG